MDDEAKKPIERGRPPTKQINWKKFDKLCEDQCTIDDIASVFDMTTETVEKRVRDAHNCSFSTLFNRKRRPGLMSLRSRMHAKAMSGDTSMLVWLNKKYAKKMDIKDDAEEVKEIKCTISSIEVNVVENSKKGDAEIERLARNDTPIED